MLRTYLVCREKDREREKHTKKNKESPWPESASVLYRPRDRRLSAKLEPTFADRVCHMDSVTDPYDRILGFLDWREKHAVY
jgi:hypothetical protein